MVYPEEEKLIALIETNALSIGDQDQVPPRSEGAPQTSCREKVPHRWTVGAPRRTTRAQSLKVPRRCTVGALHQMMQAQSLKVPRRCTVGALRLTTQAQVHHRRAVKANHSQSQLPFPFWKRFYRIRRHRFCQRSGGMWNRAKT